jgi:hypothetical protein
MMKQSLQVSDSWNSSTCGLNHDANCGVYGVGVFISGLLFLIALTAIIKLQIDTKQ